MSWLDIRNENQNDDPENIFVLTNELIGFVENIETQTAILNFKLHCMLAITCHRHRYLAMNGRDGKKS